MVRQREGRAATPSAAIIDSQSVKTTEAGGPRGYDGGKKVSGRKRRLLVDTLGLVMAIKALLDTLRDVAGTVVPSLFTEVAWSALHGLVTLTRAGRLPREQTPERLKVLVGWLTEKDERQGAEVAE